MVAKLHSAAFCGIDALPVEVEVDVSESGYANTVLVGLPDAAVRESLLRVKSAIENSGYEPPRHRSVVNLAPADLRKEGPAFDLAIALGLMLADRAIQSDQAGQYMIVGELALDGRIREVNGVLSVAMLAVRLGLKGLLAPESNACEAAVVDGLDVIPVASLTQAAGFVSGDLPLEPLDVDVNSMFAEAGSYDVDYAEVRGQEHVKRALTIAAAGNHNLLMIGPPGSGKTMLAKRMPTILPPLSLQESLETTRNSLRGG